ncbi:hypothetical protein DYB31_009549 [Aphanomyces astaci]|uniref:Uncharacterized protein n=1 Tax=Aphanomyces astaci TaxID=112090 RepID=A0A397EK55_APHAT|nr:hypothetical protein DYB31_009549 [Aphanomyces astaci]
MGAEGSFEVFTPGEMEKEYEVRAGSGDLSLWKALEKGYTKVVDQLIQPPRKQYTLGSLGPSTFSFVVDSMPQTTLTPVSPRHHATREDFVVVTPTHSLHGSFWSVASSRGFSHVNPLASSADCTAPALFCNGSLDLYVKTGVANQFIHKYGGPCTRLGFRGDHYGPRPVELHEFAVALWKKLRVYIVGCVGLIVMVQLWSLRRRGGSAGFKGRERRADTATTYDVLADILHLNNLNEVCFHEKEAVISYGYNSTAVDASLLLHPSTDHAVLIQFLSQCPDVDIYLPPGLRNHGYCEDGMYTHIQRIPL